MENLQPRKVESSVQMQTGGAASLKKRFLVILLSSIINKGSIVPFWHCAVQVHQKPKKGPTSTSYIIKTSTHCLYQVVLTQGKEPSSAKLVCPPSTWESLLIHNTDAFVSKCLSLLILRKKFRVPGKRLHKVKEHAAERSLKQRGLSKMGFYF